MKLWRKLAKKDEQGRRNGREIRYQMYIQEVMGKSQKKSYTLLDQLFTHMGLQYVLTAKQVEQLKIMKEKAEAQLTEEGTPDETK